jgi:ATP-binding cassette subfamily A (ABC1) protein 3
MLLMINEFSLLCHGKSIASYPAAITIYGRPILYLIIQALVLFTFLIWGDSGWRLAVLTRSLFRADDNGKPGLWTPQSYQKCHA